MKESVSNSIYYVYITEKNVRRQYYVNTRKCKEELKKAQDLLMVYAIVKPELRLTLTHNKIVIDGFFPKPGMDCSLASSSNPSKTFIFVNDRPVHVFQMFVVVWVVRQHYLAQYPADSARSHYPTMMLNITVPTSTVDVNLTPDKTQILLQNKVPYLKPLPGCTATACKKERESEQHGHYQPNDLTFPLLEDDIALTCTEITNPGPAKGLERLNNHDQDSNKGKDVEHDLGLVEFKGQSSPCKKVFNTITEKRVALMAYNLISSRAVRTPLSPAALFERETRAEVLQEKPAASLQDITTAVQERWKNLGEEDRKKRREAPGPSPHNPYRSVWLPSGRGFIASRPRVAQDLGASGFILAEYTQALWNMEKGSPELSGVAAFSDPRLLANGFQIRLTPGRGEAARLARQLPVTLAKEVVEDTLSQMQQQLEETSQACIHGQAFSPHLSDVPDTEQEALKIMSNVL
ncbi:unnamed protein product [Coregonus sp. 'balchen']|nr:unnamed protein product [Coregonus sp. 'balchen']